MKFKSTKVLATAVAVTIIATGVAGCNRDGGAGSSASGTVVFAVSTQTNPFFVQLVDGAKKEAKAKGVNLQVQDASDDAATQANQLANAVSTSAKVVIVNPTDSDAVAPSVKALNKAKIPVITVDRSSSSGDVDSFIASDNIAGGIDAAKKLAEIMGDKGEVIHLQGTPGASASRDRGKGFSEEIAKHPGIKVVAKQTANFDRSKALDVTTNLMQAHSKATGIFAENDEMAIGAISALGSKAGQSAKVVGFDGTADGIKAVKAGTMGATIAQQPALLGKTAVDQAADILAGKQVSKTTPIKVVLVGAVGKDPTAETALSLLSEGVGLDGAVRRDVLTGTAVVMVADSGENSIIVIAAANGTVDAQTVRAQAERIQDADVAVCQGEIPPDGIAEAARGAKRFVFNLAPVVDVDPEVIRMADPLVVNEHEAALVALALGSTTSRLEDDPDAALRELLNLGCRSVVITLGSAGCIVGGPEGFDAVAAATVKAVDTVGAGDAFVGALAAELARGRTLVEGCRFATAVATLTVTKPGAQASYPSADEVESIRRGEHA